VDSRTSQHVAAAIDLDLDLPLDIETDAASILAVVETPAPAHPELTSDERAILDFERQWWRQAGAKEQAIRDNFEMSPTRYYQALNRVIALPQALSYDPALVNRLLRMRADAPRARRLR
jgi:hypothetical protein